MLSIPKTLVVCPILLLALACSGPKSSGQPEPDNKKDLNSDPIKKSGFNEPKKSGPEAVSGEKTGPVKKAPAPKIKPKATPKKEPVTGDPKKATTEPPTKKATPKKAADDGQVDVVKKDDDQRDAKIKILQGLNTQRERRIAGLLRELAATKNTADAERLLGARALEALAKSKKENIQLKRELAKARAGLPSTAPKASNGNQDERFLPGGDLDPNEVVARVNGEAVSRGDLFFRLYYNYALDYFDAFLRIKMVEQEAARLKIKVSEQECIVWASRQMVTLSSQNGGDKKFAERLKKEGKSLELIEAVLRVNAEYGLLVQKIVELRRQTPEGQSALEKQARQEYDRKYTPSIVASHIYWRVNAKPGTPEWKKAYSKAQEVKKKILAGAKFDEMAKKHSQDEETAKSGGSLGMLDREKYKSLPVFNNALFNLKVNQAQIVSSKVGIHIIKVTQIVPPSLSWSQAKAKIFRDMTAAGPTRGEMDQLLNSLQKKSTMKRLLKLR
ncbi:MAG: peptidylprolyl isomerase [Planctomycetota bacterium]|nr:peptidylprolyl isomerase [Planctomycetota bacterium]